jgi:DNA modification methylase
MTAVTILVGDVLERLAELSDESVHCVVTSPPYWNMRDYGVPGQIGLEPTLGEHMAVMVEVFREVRRVLRRDGTLWLNYGDFYITTESSNTGKKRHTAGTNRDDVDVGGWGKSDDSLRWRSASKLKCKDLCMLPNRLAIALQEDGWWVRSEIIWSKPNPMPESVTDRPTSAHEKLWLLSKSERYFYDAEAVNGSTPTEGRNLHNVWKIATKPFPEAHFATFPPALVEPCIKAGTSEKGRCSVCGAPRQRITKTTYRNPGNRTTNGLRSLANRHQTAGFGHRLEKDVSTTGWQPSCTCAGETVACTVLDPFGGAGTTGLVASRLGRNAVLIEINSDYAEMARRRIEDDAPMLVQVKMVPPVMTDRKTTKF